MKYLTSPGWYELNDTTEYNGGAVRLKPAYITTPEFKAKLDFHRSEVLKDIRRDGGEVSNGEVKRFMAIVENPIFAYDDVRRLCVLESDHERVVAKKDAAYNSLDDVNMALNEKIAKQAKVIEVLKACILKEDKRCGI